MSDDFSEPNEPTDEELKAMNDTDNQLKQLLAKMSGDAEGVPFCGRIESEYLHLCSLVEAGLTDSEYIAFAHALNEAWMRDVKPQSSRSATWQQRTAALAEVKGVRL